jgi:hypothetical protein
MAQGDTAQGGVPQREATRTRWILRIAAEALVTLGLFALACDDDDDANADRGCVA